MYRSRAHAGKTLLRSCCRGHQNQNMKSLHYTFTIYCGRARTVLREGGFQLWIWFLAESEHREWVEGWGKPTGRLLPGAQATAQLAPQTSISCISGASESLGDQLGGAGGQGGTRSPAWRSPARGPRRGAAHASQPRTVWQVVTPAVPTEEPQLARGRGGVASYGRGAINEVHETTITAPQAPGNSRRRAASSKVAHPPLLRFVVGRPQCRDRI